MAQVTKDILPASRTVRDDGSGGLLGGLLAKAILFTDYKGCVLAAHCEIDRVRTWVDGLIHRPAGEQPSSLRALIQQALAAGKPVCNREMAIPSPPGGPEMFHGSASPVFNPDGAVTGVTVAIYDLAPVQELSSNLGQLVRLASIGTLSAGLAHEIKNAMVAVNTFAEVLVHKHKETELAPIVSREIRRIDQIVGQLLRVSAPGRAEFRSLSVHELLNHTLAVTQHRLAGGQIRLVRQLEANPDWVLGEGSQLEQAFINLLFNAVEAMGSRGSLTVGSTFLHLANEDPIVRITVSDTGSGISPGNLSRLFERFFTTKAAGHGFGLFNTKRIILDHGGTIRVDSVERQGTTFTVDLPSAARQP